MTHKIVFYVDSATLGGTEQVLLYLFAHLDRTRWQPVLFHHPEPGLEPFLAEAHRLDVRTRSVPRMQGLKAVAGLAQFLRCLLAERPAIFHAHLSWLLSCKYGLVAAALAGVPGVIATLHQFLLQPWGRSTYFQQRLISANVDQYTAVSAAVGRQLSEDFRVPASKISVIHNGIPLDAYEGPVDGSFRRMLAGGTDYPIILTVARLDGQKGHKFLLEAACQVPEAIFVLAGTGPEGPALEALARELGVASRVRFLGQRVDIPDLLANCDLFVLPSLYEGFPLSVLEAMAAGKAVVATAVGGTPEAVSNGENGFLVPAGDAAALAKAIRDVLSDPFLAGRMGSIGKARVRQQFSVGVMAQQVHQVYENLLKKHQ